MVRHGERSRGHVRETDLEHELADVPGQRRDLLGLLLPHRIVGQQVAIVLHGGAAARGIDDDGVETRTVDLTQPCFDVALGERERGLLASEMQDGGAAAARAGGDHDLDIVAGEQAHRRLVDIGREHLLAAARHQRHPLAAQPCGGKDLRLVDR